MRAALRLSGGLFAAALLTACPKVAAVDYSAAPRLPSPLSGSYGRDAGASADPAVAALAQGRRWDVFLSGAATSIALDAAKGPRSTATWALREDVWRAGYPYPVEAVRVFEGVPEQPPSPDLAAWLAETPASADLGLVRARSAVREVWVGVVARPRIDLGTIPRSVRRGDRVTLPPVSGARYRVAEADGGLIEGPLDDGWSATLDEDGEWVFQVLDASGVAAWFPVYVGVPAPTDDLIGPDAEPAPTPDAVVALVEWYLARLRDAYGSATWRRDVILDASARRLLTDPESTAASVLDGLGVAKPHQAWSCTAPSVEACMDAIVWDPAQRRPFLDAGYTNVGIAAAFDGSKVRIRIVLSGG